MKFTCFACSLFVFLQEGNKFQPEYKQKNPAFLQNFFCEPGRIRTFDRLLRREVLYPAELRAHFHGMLLFDPWSLRRVFKLIMLHEQQEFRRGGRIRTCDLLVPNEAR